MFFAMQAKNEGFFLCMATATSGIDWLAWWHSGWHLEAGGRWHPDAGGGKTRHYMQCIVEW